jgi:hypothetical protein
MSYRVTSGHVETLHDGRMVGPGEDVTGVDPKKEKDLIDRGALTRIETRKSRGKASEAAPDTAAAPQKEDSK